MRARLESINAEGLRGMVPDTNMAAIWKVAASRVCRAANELYRVFPSWPEMSNLLHLLRISSPVAVPWSCQSAMADVEEKGATHTKSDLRASISSHEFRRW